MGVRELETAKKILYNSRNGSTNPAVNWEIISDITEVMDTVGMK